MLAANGYITGQTINYLSVDPYMRGRISEAKSYAEPLQIGEVMVGGTIGTVVESRHPGYRPGEVVVGYWGWQEYVVSDGQGVQRFDTSLAPMSTALGVLGMPGMTVYFGLLEIGRPKAGETVFVSGAAGAVGSLVGQIDQYNATRPPRGPRLLWHLIVKQARAEGFLVFQFASRFREGQQQVAQWIKEGRVKYQESIIDGLENAPKAFIGLFHGENIGKQLVRVAE